MTQPPAPATVAPAGPRAAPALAGKRWPVALLALTLAACGGGGGSSDSTTPAPAPPPPAPAPAPTNGAPTITTQPVNVGVIAPAAASFTVAVGGTPTPTIQWQKSTDGGVSFVDIAGATSATLTLGTTSTADNASQYRAVATNSVGATTSQAATLTVTAAAVAPAITSQPTAASVTAPASATFTVAATGSPTVAYQWQRSTDGGTTFANIGGATGSTYATPATTVADSGQQFRVVVSNGQTTATSQAVVLTVAAAAAAPGAASGCTSSASYAAGFNYNLTYESPTSSGTFITMTAGNVPGTGSFHGQTATEIDETTTVTAPNASSPSLTSVTKTYTAFNAATSGLTQYGSSAVLTDQGGQTTVDTYYDPPSPDARFTLATGASTSIQTHQTVTRNGTAQPSTDESSTVTFSGIETLTIPAGTYQACKFVSTTSNSVTTTSWLFVGNGVLLKSTNGSTIFQARSVTINGTAR